MSVQAMGGGIKIGGLELGLQIKKKGSSSSTWEVIVPLK